MDLLSDTPTPPVATVEDWLEQVAPTVARHRLERFLEEVEGREDVAVDYVTDHRTATAGIVVRFGLSNLPQEDAPLGGGSLNGLSNLPGGGKPNSLARSYYVYADAGRTYVVRIVGKSRATGSVTELVSFGRGWVAAAPKAEVPIPTPRRATPVASQDRLRVL